MASPAHHGRCARSQWRSPGLDKQQCTEGAETSTPAVRSCGYWLSPGGENPSGGRSRHRWFGQPGGPLPSCRALCVRKCAPNLPLRARTNGPPSGLQKPLKALANLLMGKIIAPLETFFAALHGLDKAGFFLEIARKSILHQLVGAAALLGGGVGQLRFQFPSDVHFHLFDSFSENTLTDRRVPPHYIPGLAGSACFRAACLRTCSKYCCT